MSIHKDLYGMGILPGEWDPLKKTLGQPNQTINKLDQFLTSPGGGFLMNLLAQSGYSTIPQSPFGAIGRAALMNQQQQQARGQAALQEQLIRSRIGLQDAQAKEALASIAPQGLDAEAINKIVNELADDVRAESKDYSLQSAAYGRIRASAINPSPAGDLALIFNYMKVLDPGSTVREGEFANAQNSGSVPQRVRALYNQVVQGTRLTDQQRADFVNRAGRLFNSAVEEQAKKNEKFRQRGINAKIPEAYIDPILPSVIPVELAPYSYQGGGDNPEIAALRRQVEALPEGERKRQALALIEKIEGGG